MDNPDNAGKSGSPLSMKTQLICGLLISCLTLAGSLGFQRLTPTSFIAIAIVAVPTLIFIQNYRKKQRAK
jgi:hypothetical protein